ncbi:MAG: HEAT repeat domain-containing protein [Planctomycetes bacterium]|nr:HEAT repeat domain-containing protein [Planctomycetota bacterium]
MAIAFGKSILATAVALVVGGAALAQSELKEAVKQIRLGTPESRAQGLEMLRAILAKDPSSADALALYQSVTQDEWFMLMVEAGEYSKIAQSILDRAKVEMKTRSRDAAAIGALVDAACAADSNYETRSQAVRKIIGDHGEFAVPAFVAKLGNADDANGQINAISALAQIGPVAVLPLLEATKSSNGVLRLNAAAALVHLNDDRAVPAMARLRSDDRQDVRDVAERFLAKKNVPAGKTATELALGEARRYLKQGFAPGSYSEVVWKINGETLEFADVPALVYSLELAKGLAHDAVAADPMSAEARSVAAQANLAEAQVIENAIAQGDEAAKALEPMAAEFKMAALATGTPVLRAALAEGLQNGMAPVSLGAIEALGASEDRTTLGSSTLTAALQSTDKRVRYAAAMALAKASGGSNVPASDAVVAALAAAVSEESVRIIQVIDASPEAKVAASEAGGVRGNVAVADASARDGMSRLLDNPNVDVVVINEILPDRMPEDVIGNIKKDSRMANTKVVVVAKDVEAAKTRFGDGVTVVQGPLGGEGLITAVNTALEGVAVEPANARAEGFAKGASEALLALATGNSNIGGSLASLAGQLNRSDAVSVPAAKALGLSGTGDQLDALLAAVSGSGSGELKVAAASAMGGILGRMSDAPAKVVEGLKGVLLSGAEPALRTAIAVALGKAKLSDAEKASLIEALRKVGSVAKSEG